ncbi:hypothetical protein [Brachyspira alvinipulli]|uniref:hypothetical protein n=1 Tax=Brachyspira alvinipulli TaxID=84379 RepID=UPI000488C697|nr:hypothetical protein [Brachyspira alvinipulli]
MKRNLLTFIGVTDIKTHERKEYNGAIEQILHKYNFENVYVFITAGLENNVNDLNMLERYKEISNSNVVGIYTKIEDPTNPRVVYNKMKEYIEEINTSTKNIEGELYVNMVSSTPQIISILSLLVGSKTLYNSIGIYPSNPLYSDEIKFDNLDFYGEVF